MLTCWHSAAAVELLVGQRIAFVFLPVLGLWHLVASGNTLPLERPHPPRMVFCSRRGILRDQIIPRYLCNLRTAHFGDGGRVMLPDLLLDNFALSQQCLRRTESRPRSWHCSPPRFPLLCRVGTQPRNAYLQAGMPWHNWKRASLGDKYGLGAINISF